MRAKHDTAKDVRRLSKFHGHARLFSTIAGRLCWQHGVTRADKGMVEILVLATRSLGKIPAGYFPAGNADEQKLPVSAARLPRGLRAVEKASLGLERSTLKDGAEPAQN